MPLNGRGRRGILGLLCRLIDLMDERLTVEQLSTGRARSRRHPKAAEAVGEYPRWNKYEREHIGGIGRRIGSSTGFGYPVSPMPLMPLDLIGRTLRRNACQRLSNIRMGNSKLSGNMGWRDTCLEGSPYSIDFCRSQSRAGFLGLAVCERP
jgi:hypothetical protein